MTPDLTSILDMFAYCRPAGSKSETKFVNRFLIPVGFKRDYHENLVLKIGDKPRILFSSHVDTVHRQGGTQALQLDKDGVLTSYGNDCLGADDTAGIWLMLEMIKAKIPGVYVIHHAEEKGCIGSRSLAQGDPDFLKDIDIAIAFDRAYYSDVITHQMGMRTASDTFAHSLAKELGGQYQPCSEGAYTDTNEYAHLVSECTNISVGYCGQHSKHETQDTQFLIELRDTLLRVNWDNLVVARDPSVIEEEEDGGAGWMWGGWSSRKPRRRSRETMEDLVELYPEVIAEILSAYGIREEDVREYIEEYHGEIAA